MYVLLLADPGNEWSPACNNYVCDYSDSLYGKNNLEKDRATVNLACAALTYIFYIPAAALSKSNSSFVVWSLLAYSF